MNYYVIYDKKSGRVLQTHTSYVLGDDQPVACDTEELSAQAKEDFGDSYEPVVVQAPSDFDPRPCTHRLAVDHDGKVVMQARHASKGGA